MKEETEKTKKPIKLYPQDNNPPERTNMNNSDNDNDLLIKVVGLEKI